MSELDIARLLNDKVVDFGNERFLEGWNGATEHIIKLLEDDLWHDIRFVTRSPDEEQTKYHDGECLGCRQIALIKGESQKDNETVVLLTEGEK